MIKSCKVIYYWTSISKLTNTEKHCAWETYKTLRCSFNAATKWIAYCSPWCANFSFTVLKGELHVPQISRFVSNHSLGSAWISISPTTETGLPHALLPPISEQIWLTANQHLIMPVCSSWHRFYCQIAMWHSDCICVKLQGHFFIKVKQF